MRISLEQRSDAPRWLGAAVPIGSVLAALLLGAVFLLVTGYSPTETYGDLLRNGYTTWRGFTDTLGDSTILICTGMAAAFAFQMNLYNIGGEGQLYVGMLGGAWAGLALGPHLPSYLAVPAVLLFAAAAGASWVAVPAVVRSRFGSSEIVTTLLLTYVAANLVNYFFYTRSSFFRPPNANFPEGRKVAESATLDPLAGNGFYLSFFVAVAIALALFWVVRRTEFGYRIQVLADSERAARYAGINGPRTTMLVLLASGALAGLGGGMLIVGPYGRIDDAVLGVGYGYAGIVVAALARYNFVAIIVAGILFAGLRSGGERLQITSETPIHISVILQGAILLFALGGEVFRRNRLRIVRTESAVSEAGR